MKPVNEIYSEFLLGNVRFHRAIENDLFRDALMFFMDNKFSTSASLCSTLYEMIFTTRLVRETANPIGFIPSKENINEQLKYLMEKENDIINTQKLSFRQITKELKNKNVISEIEKQEYDTFYTEIRNPVAHGLTFRLFEKLLDSKPAHTFEVETNYQPVYKKASELLIDKIYYLMAIKELRKK
ncbi:hypothetical protein [Algibacter luteus]|uniref:hypothetical protein n=1 Tax=Algibacter luteus TaxID=1178825 RepID=UPI0025949192|nr:hypothetical protein [Algibacter luteus]WJJ95300.1 hypothetical protein O5O44_08705 [Algibacter luteus]